MKTNVLLLDSYKNIENLISYAFSFSNRFSRKLKINYVFDFKWMSQSYATGTLEPMETGLVQAEKQAREEFEIAKAKIKSLVDEYLKHNIIRIPFEIETTEVSRIELVEEELKKDPDMILLVGNHQSYAEKFGSLINYPNIVEHVKCPVLVIPDNVGHFVLKDAVYATNYNPEDICSLKHLSDFLKQAEHSHVTVLHNENNYDFDEQIKWTGFRQIVKEEVDFDNIDFKIKNRKDFLKGIEEFSSDSGTDLLVLLHEKKGFFEDVFSKNEVKNVLTHLDKPVLVYHEQ